MRENPENCIAFNNRSLYYAKLGHYEKALQDAEFSIQMNPNDEFGYRRKSEALLGQLKIDEAKVILNKSIELIPHSKMLKDEFQKIDRNLNILEEYEQ